MKLKDFDFRIWHKDSKSFVEMKVSDTEAGLLLLLRILERALKLAGGAQ